MKKLILLLLVSAPLYSHSMSPDELQATFKNLVQASDTATITTTPFAQAQISKVIAPANTNRKGLIIYNNCGNSIYVAFAATANSANNMTIIIPTFAHWVMPAPIYRGVISAIKNAGTTGSIQVTELL